MKAQLYLKPLAITAFAGALASQVPFVGTYLSFFVVLFFLWKMARVDIFPDGALILIIGKGSGLIMMIYVVAIAMDFSDPQEMASLNEVPIYEDEDGKEYYSESGSIYYLGEDGERVIVDGTELLGISEMMEVANQSPADQMIEDALPEEPSIELAEPPVSEVTVASNEDESIWTSEPLISDSIIRGQEIPFEMFVPQGWLVRQSSEVVSIGIEDHVYFNCYSSKDYSDNKSYLRTEVNRAVAKYSGYQIMKQEVVSIDGKQWARLQFINDPGDQVLLLTHSSKLGSFTIELNGSFKQLSHNKGMLHRILYSFNFPPSTYLLAQLESEE